MIASYAMIVSMKHARLLDTIGWIGTVLILGGYGLYSLGVISDVMVFHYCNLAGSLGVATISAYRRVWQPFVINICMGLFATIAIIRHFL